MDVELCEDGCPSHAVSMCVCERATPRSLVIEKKGGESLFATM